MVSSIGEGIKERLAAIWDTTSTATLLGTGSVIVIATVFGVLWLGREDGSVGSGREVVAGVAATTNEPAPVDEIEEPEPDRDQPFFVVGDDIVDPEGNIFVPIGTNATIRATDYPYVFDGGNGGVNGRVESIKAWGWNTIRASLQCFNETGNPTQREIINGIDETVRELTEAKIVVVLTCHDATGSDLELETATELQVRAFWDEVVLNYSDNTYVWFNFFNEPFKSRLSDDWVELHRFYFDRYRNQGVDNIMVFDLPEFGQAIDLAANNSFVNDLGRSCNTVLGWHAWGALDGEQATSEDYAEFAQTVRGRGLAVMIGEAGVPFPLEAGTAGNPEWNASGYYSALEVASTTDVGLLWWHGTGDTSDDLFYPLKLDRSGFWTADNSGNLTEAGTTFWEYSTRERFNRRFAGDVTNSGCDAAIDLLTGTESVGQ